MSEEVLINVTPRETRVAIVENGVLQELMIERTNRRGLVSNIYKGKVCRVLPGMQAAFVDIGLERAAFLHASDIISTGNGLINGSRNDNISELLHDGQALLVQIIKEPLGTKGARLTTQISIPSRYVVFMPHSPNMIGISTRIEREEERRRLKETVLNYMGVEEHPSTGEENSSASMTNDETMMIRTISSTENKGMDQYKRYGFIIRTAAEGVSDKMLCADMAFLCHLWKDILDKENTLKPCSLVYEDLPLAARTVRDLIGSSVEEIHVDSRAAFQDIVNFASKFVPDLVPHIKHYPGERPIFDLYNIEDEINRALERKVQLKSGGYLVIDQTEAMTTIDVNTGAFVGSRNLEETIFKTNLEAAQAIARQLRLRNLGGIIILDFIDMMDIEHRRQVLRTLEKCLEKDHTKSHISDVSALGLVQMTRKRTRESLEHILCESCPLCDGRGSIKSVETVCYEIFREILREQRQFEPESFLVLASTEVVERMIDEESDDLAELESFINSTVRLQVEGSYTQEQYDIVPT